MFEPATHATIADRYRLVREIGRGGMGAVWEAFDIELDAPCALKFILNQSAKPPEVRARFLREARAVARLQSPHVVNIRSVGEWQGALYIAMELLIGETLFDRLTSVGTLTPRDTSRVVDQVASVLTASHAAGIVHRDLKPENIWLWSHADIFVKVLDFGVAKQVEVDNPLLKTATGMLVGTPYYMSPEQAAGDRHVDHRSDVWSLAIIAAECLSGRRPFQTTGLGQLLASIISGPTPPITDLYAASTPALVDWWALATARDPKDRYPSARALAEGLAVALRVPSVSATAPAPAAYDSLTDARPTALAGVVPSRQPLAATSSLSPVTHQPPTPHKLPTELAQTPANLFERQEPPLAKPLLETLMTPAPSVSPLAPSASSPSSEHGHPTAANPTEKPLAAAPRWTLLAALALAAVGAAVWLGRAPEDESIQGTSALPTSPASSVASLTSAAGATLESPSHHSGVLPSSSAVSPAPGSADGSPNVGSSEPNSPATGQAVTPAPSVSALERARIEPDARVRTPRHVASAATAPSPTKPKPAVTPKPKAASKPPAPSLEKRIGF